MIAPKLPQSTVSSFILLTVKQSLLLLLQLHTAIMERTLHLPLVHCTLVTVYVLEHNYCAWLFKGEPNVRYHVYANKVQDLISTRKFAF